LTLYHKLLKSLYNSVAWRHSRSHVLIAPLSLSFVVILFVMAMRCCFNLLPASWLHPLPKNVRVRHNITITCVRTTKVFGPVKPQLIYLPYHLYLSRPLLIRYPISIGPHHLHVAVIGSPDMAMDGHVPVFSPLPVRLTRSWILLVRSGAACGNGRARPKCIGETRRGSRPVRVEFLSFLLGTRTLRRDEIVKL